MNQNKKLRIAPFTFLLNVIQDKGGIETLKKKTFVRTKCYL